MGPETLGGQRKGGDTTPKASSTPFKTLPVSFRKKKETFFSVIGTSLEPKLSFITLFI